MNPFLELHKTVDAQARGSDAVRVLAEQISDSGLDPRQIERTVDSLRKAFRDHLEERKESPTQTFCSFCHKPQEEVAVLVAAATAAICDECCQISAGVLAEQTRKGRRERWFKSVTRLVGPGKRRS